MGKDRPIARRDQWTSESVAVASHLTPPDHPRRLTAADILARRDAQRDRLGAWRPAPTAAAPLAVARFSLSAFRVISPIIVPLALGFACLMVITLVGTLAPLGLAVGADALPPLFFIYAALGVLFAAALAYAPSETLWSVTLLGGLTLNVTIAIWAIFGALAGVALICGVGALGAVVLRAQAHMVLEHTAHVMVLFGKYHRTLRPGFNVRLPGERVLAIVPTAEITLGAHVAETTLLDGARLTAAATVCCRVIPERAHLAAPRSADWPEQVRQLAVITLADTLAEMSASDALDPRVDEPLGTRLRGRLQALVGGWGIQIEWVRPHGLRPVTAGTVVGADSGPRPVITAETIVARGVTPGALLPLPPAMLSGRPMPAALAEAYDAVRERRITDPSTIARVARAFEAAADDPILRPHLLFDAAAAARHLRGLVSALEADAPHT